MELWNWFYFSTPSMAAPRKAIPVAEGKIDHSEEPPTSLVGAVVIWHTCHSHGDGFGERFLHACTRPANEAFVPSPRAPNIGNMCVSSSCWVKPEALEKGAPKAEAFEVTLPLFWDPSRLTLPLLKHYNPRVTVVCFDATGGEAGCGETLRLLGDEWTRQATINLRDVDSEHENKQLPIFLVGLLGADIEEQRERITAEQALAAAGEGAVAYFECRPSDARRTGCAELMQTLGRFLAWGRWDGNEVVTVLPEKPGRGLCTVQ